MSIRTDVGTVEDLHASATKACGLDDFGVDDDNYREALAMLLESFARDADLTEFGSKMNRFFVRNALVAAEGDHLGAAIALAESGRAPKVQPAIFALAAGISGFPYWAHDAGGFLNSPTDAMYRQWAMAMGSFSPIWKPHGPGLRFPWAPARALRWRSAPS